MRYRKRCEGFTRACWIPHPLLKLDPGIVRIGHVLLREQAIGLLQDFTIEEVDKALAAIHSSKAPGFDGWNSYFFKQVWSLIRKDVFQAMMLFF